MGSFTGGSVFGGSRLRDMVPPTSLPTPAPIPPPALNPVTNPISTIVGGNAGGGFNPPGGFNNPVEEKPAPRGPMPVDRVIGGQPSQPISWTPPTGIIGSLVKGIGGTGRGLPISRGPNQEKPNLQKSQRMNPEVVNRPIMNY